MVIRSNVQPKIPKLLAGAAPIVLNPGLGRGAGDGRSIGTEEVTVGTGGISNEGMGASVGITGIVKAPAGTGGTLGIGGRL